MKKIFLGCIILIFQHEMQAQSPDTSMRRKNMLAKTFVAPVTLIGLGLYTKQSGSLMNRFAVRDWRNEHYPNFKHNADDHIQFIPIWVVYGLAFAKVKPKNDFVNRTILLVKSELLMNVMVWSLKYSTGVFRPDETNYHAFPSGHTAQAFVAATFMHKELGHKSIWYSIGAYSMATSVGVFRVLNNKHWISDVLAGAGFGILSTNIAYATHRYKWGKKPGLVMLPTYSNGPGIFVSWRLD